MLQKEIVQPGTLELLMKLMQDEKLKDFILVGGTALALQIGHRDSIDIDLFSQKPFEQDKMDSYLQKQYGFLPAFLDKNTVSGSINGVKVDLITHDYPYVKEPMLVESVRMATKEDISAMKLNAISGNGTRIKDFIDIAYLSSSLSLNDMINAFEKKYPNANAMMIPKGLVYHQDINFKEPVKMADNRLVWKKIEERLHRMIVKPNEIFKPLSMFDEMKKQNVTKKGFKL